jgi:hypothetical protein
MVIHPEVFLAAGYAAFLLGVALGVDPESLRMGYGKEEAKP